MSFPNNPIQDASIRLGSDAQTAGLPHLIIGGNAVIHYGVARFTRDVDFLVPEFSAVAWRDHLENSGYECYHAAGPFMQFEAKSGNSNLVPIDLMIVNAATWEKLLTASEMEVLGDDYKAHWPAALHLVALKLHAWRGPFRTTKEQDWEDVIALVRHCGINLDDPAVAETIDSYGGAGTLERLKQIKQVSGAE